MSDEESKIATPATPKSSAKALSNLSQHAVEIPFNLSELFNLSYSFDTLKKTLEWLANKQGALDDRIANLEKEKLNQMEYYEFKHEVNTYIKRNNAEKDAIRKIDANQDTRLAALEDQVQLLKTMSAPAGAADGADPGEGMLDALKNMVANLRDEMMTRLGDLKELIKQVDTDSKERDESINSKIADLE